MRRSACLPSRCGLLLLINVYCLSAKSAADAATHNAFGRKHGLKQRLVDASLHSSAKLREEEPEHIHLSIEAPVDINEIDLTSSMSETRGEDTYTFHDVCPLMNSEAEDQETRGLIWFDKSYKHAKRCVPCNNPIMSFKWDAPHHADTPGEIEGDYVRDTSGIDSGRWRKEGGLLRNGGHKCGMMWAHKIMAHNLSDFNECFEYNKQEIKDRGQPMRPQVVKKVVYHKEPTLLIQYKRKNSGHQLMDGLLSIWPTLAKNENGGEFSKVIIQQDWNCSKPGSRYICEIMRGLGAFDNGVEFINTEDENTAHCFKELIWPVSGLYGRGQASMPSKIFLNFHNGILKHYGLPLPRTDQKKKRMMFYAHCSTPRRCWLNVEETMKVMGEVFDVFTVHDFGALTIQKQAEAFNSADILPMIHGGQMSNIVFCAKGAWIYEISCTGYSHVRSALDTSLIGVHHEVVGLGREYCEKPKVISEATAGQGELDWNVNYDARSLSQRLFENTAISGDEHKAVIKAFKKRL